MVFGEEGRAVFEDTGQESGGGGSDVYYREISSVLFVWFQGKGGAELSKCCLGSSGSCQIDDERARIVGPSTLPVPVLLVLM